MPQRIQRKRTKGWKMPEGAVYVGRGCGMPWGNPWRVESAEEAGYKDPQTMVVYAFRKWLEGDPDWQRPAPDMQRDFILANLGSLRGKDLACWCRLDQACHADVLLELANAPPSLTNHNRSR